MKYELTSPKINGSIILWFDDRTGQLSKAEIDCELEVVQMQFLASMFPVHIDMLNVYKEKKTFTIRMLEEKPTFEAFWDKYEKKENKIDAQNAWGKLKSIDQQRAIAYIKRYDSILSRDGYRPKMLAASYLNKRLWMDVVG